VQGGAEVGCAPAIDAATQERWEQQWGFAFPRSTGYSAPQMIDVSAEGGLDAFWLVGGNFLETLPDREKVHRALSMPRLRVHEDLVISSAMLVDPSETVLLLPATTRYESPGGGTETTTERRVIFSPEIAGRRIGDARPEWWAITEAAARAYPDRAHLIRFADAAAIRRDIEQAVPLYRGIERLSAKGDQLQWGGRVLYADGRFATADGKAHFAAVAPRAVSYEPGTFLVSTRRGKQFNSMVQKQTDSLTGASRDAVLMSREDAVALQLSEGTRVKLVSPYGHFLGRVFPAPVKPGNLEVHWPEGTALLGPELDPESMEPDYNAVVTVEKVDRVERS
jgi:predicted molibdopterin-dependent oxidoreductase YjgC